MSPRALIAAVVLTLVPVGAARAEWRGPVTFETFRGPLAAHGQWLGHSTYGQVWRPTATVEGWRPYWDGQWEWTEAGWSWASSEPWAWATYRYGRWAWDAGWGWFWVPGYQWAPAWVDWRYDEGTVGWAPLAPAGWQVRPSAYHLYWTHVPTRSFAGVHVRGVAYGWGRVDALWARTHQRWTGYAPPRAHIERLGWRHSAAPGYSRPNTAPHMSGGDRHFGRPNDGYRNGRYRNEGRQNASYQSRPSAHRTEVHGATPARPASQQRPVYQSRPSAQRSDMHGATPARSAPQQRPAYQSRPSGQRSDAHSATPARPGAPQRGGRSGHR